MLQMTNPSAVMTGISRSVAQLTGKTDTNRPRMPEPIFLEWLTLAGLFVFAAWLLGVQGVWALLLGADPTGITLIIIAIFTGATLWCGTRAQVLSYQREKALRLHLEGATGVLERDSWASDYLAALKSSPKDPTAPIDTLLEKTHGPHATAWWVNGIQLKLGLLGKVIGFSIMALEIGNIESFDAADSQELLKNLTAGLGVALLTTMVGLVGNILLGLQLTRLDRYADDIVSRAQNFGLQRVDGQKTSGEETA